MFLLLTFLAIPIELEAGRTSRRSRSSSRRSSSSTKYVNVADATLKRTKGISAENVAQLARGDKLKVVDKGDGRWIKVALAENSDVSGWIYFNKVVSDKPKDIGKSLALGGGITTTDLETGGAIRGLKKASKEYAVKKNISQSAIDDLHRIQVFPSSIRNIGRRVEAFRKDGKLGEYSE